MFWTTVKAGVPLASLVAVTEELTETAEERGVGGSRFQDNRR